MQDGDRTSKRLFAARVGLVGEIEENPELAKEDGLTKLRGDVVTRLKAEVAGMNVDNFEVRPKRRLVEKYQEPDAWAKLGLEPRVELAENVAGLPSSFEDDDVTATQFDLLMLRAQLSLLQADPRFASHQKRIRQLASLLEELPNIPMVAAEMELILEMQNDEYWQNITAPMLETARRKLRNLIKLIEIKRRPNIYTDFEDEIGTGTELEVSGTGVGTDMRRFRLKIRHFLKDHMDHIAIQKLRRNEALTAQDIEELERILIDAGVASNEQRDSLKNDGGLGVLIRSMVGLDRAAAKSALSDFTGKYVLTADQTEFVSMVTDYLTDRGVMEARVLYESPFTDINSLGVEGLFESAEVVELIAILEAVRRKAVA